MIRIVRGSEPRALATVRRRELARAILHWSSSDTSDFTGYAFDGYREAAAALYWRQRCKCALCERLPGFENQPVEHFRPKGGAQRNETTRDPHHYWWLAWSWENLFFACARCNGALTKANEFPLEDGTAALPLPARQAALAIDAASLDTSSERPLLLDPAQDDPMAHIIWQPSNVGDPWSALAWRPYGVDRRGQRTIEVLALHGPHAGDVSMEIGRHLTTKMERIRAALAANDPAARDAEWDEVLKLFAPEAPYRAAMYDACCWFLDQPEMAAGAALRAQLPYPSAVAIVDTTDSDDEAPSDDDPPELTGCSARLLLQMRGQVFAHRVREGVLALCAERDLDEPTLARLLDCEVRTVADHRRDLVREQRLVPLADGRYRAMPAAQ